MEYIVLLGLFQKWENMWVSLACWDMLVFPRDQAIEMTEKQVKVNPVSVLLWFPLVSQNVPYSSAQHTQIKVLLSS